MNSALIRLVDDDPKVADSLRFFLQAAGYDVVAYSSAPAFLEEDDASRRGCVVLDVRMPQMSGIECQREMIARHADLPIVFLSAHADVSLAVSAVQRGASGFVVKPPKVDALLGEIEKAVALHEKRQRMRRELERIEQQLAQLTPSEFECAQLIAKGLSNAEIAELLGISEGTVRHRRADISTKLETRNAVEVAELFSWQATLKQTLP